MTALIVVALVAYLVAGVGVATLFFWHEWLSGQWCPLTVVIWPCTLAYSAVCMTVGWYVGWITQKRREARFATEFHSATARLGDWRSLGLTFDRVIMSAPWRMLRDATPKMLAKLTADDLAPLLASDDAKDREAAMTALQHVRPGKGAVA